VKPEHNDAGAIAEVRTGSAIMLFCVGVIGLSFGVPLLMTLPQMLDAAASAPPLIQDTLRAATAQPLTAASEPTFHERHALKATDSWADTLDESQLAAWRMRSSD
jgi:hypothetical protein